MKFYVCKKCGNIITIKEDEINVCCDETMQELIPNTTDGALEKHVPVYEIIANKIKVTVGSVEHPMLDNHYINFVALINDNGVIKIDLKPGDKPTVMLPYIKNSKIYEYCNLHGLWEKTVE